ncbi:Spy/CpxP family protein refolding chaperone [Roseivirga sp.]|uniref:Spy/CpxP family protein refolding chaperone n=1 Tax=Roseivirga sp. TaxID=1964215 RepID=UPI003B8D62FD
MKTQNLKKYGFALATLVFLGTSAQAQRFQGNERPDRPQQEMKQGQKLAMGKQHGPQGPKIPNLTEEQKEQLHSFRLESEKASLPIKNQVAEKEARLKTLVTSESYNEKAVNKVIEEIGDLKTGLMKLKVAEGQKVKNILNEEQLVAFNNQIAQGLKQRMGKGPGQKGGQHRGPSHGR